MSEYIERDALREKLKTLKECAVGKEFKDGIIAAMLEVKDFPAADVEPVVRGKWIEHLHGGTDEYGYLHETTYYTCSNCGRVVTSTTTRCHTCFAHMERSGSGE